MYLILLLPTLAIAWGRSAHQLTAGIAQTLLTESTLAEIDLLLPNDTIVDIASWADQIKRKRSWTKHLHYSNPADNEPESCSYETSRDCPNEECIIGAIYNFSRRLESYDYDLEERSEALKFLVHFIGDCKP